MPKSNRFLGRLLVLALSFACGRAANAQDTAPPAPTPTPEAPAPVKESEPLLRPPEGSVIINLPSANTNPLGSLQFMITHRFSEPVQDSTIHDFYSFFSPANVGLDLSYVPIRNLETGFLRSQEIEDYEVFAKYSLCTPTNGAFDAAVRIGGDFRTARGLEHRSSFFAQTTLAFTIANRIRISAVPTFSSRAVGQVLPPQENVFNVLGAVSIAVTRTFNVHGEIVPRAYGSPGTGWIVSIEKTLLRHRWSFTVGNQRGTTVDQYVIWQPPFFVGNSPSNVYFGFNIVRLWQLK